MSEPEPVWVWLTTETGDTKHHTSVAGRAAKMIHWLRENERRVNLATKGEVRFCFAGDSLAIHVTEVDTT